MEVKILHKQGLSSRKIAKQLGISKNTVKRHLRQLQPTIYRKKNKVLSKLDLYKGYIMSRIEAAHPMRIPVPVIFREICQQGYKGKIRTLNYFIHELSQGQNPEEKVIRFETLPGQQMFWSNKNGHSKSEKIKII